MTLSKKIQKFIGNFSENLSNSIIKSKFLWETSKISLLQKFRKSSVSSRSIFGKLLAVIGLNKYPTILNPHLKVYIHACANPESFEISPRHFTSVLRAYFLPRSAFRRFGNRRRESDITEDELQWCTQQLQQEEKIWGCLIYYVIKAWRNCPSLFVQHQYLEFDHFCVPVSPVAKSTWRNWQASKHTTSNIWLLRSKNFSDLNPKHFCLPSYKMCLPNTTCLKTVVVAKQASKNTLLKLFHVRQAMFASIARA